MKNEQTIKNFEKMYAGKIIDLNENLMPVIRDTTSPEARTPDLCEKKILKEPECRTALAIMIREYGGLYLPEKP